MDTPMPRGADPLAAEAPALQRFTAAQFDRMVRAGIIPEGGPSIELRGGLIWRMSPQYVPHMRTKRRLFRALEDAIRAAGLPFDVDTEGSVHLGDADIPMPDIIVWDPIDTDGWVPGDRVRLLVEVSSRTLADDLGPKRDLYAAATVPEYWVADVKGRVVHLHAVPADGRYTQTARIPFGEPLSALTIPNLTLAPWT